MRSDSQQNNRLANIAPAAPPLGATITYRNEPWTAECARLLLEVDEGWIGFRGDLTWSWHENTFKVYSAICRERNWPCKSLAASVAMIMYLRTGGISMKLSNAVRTVDGFAQWSLKEMRELGAQMRRVVDGKMPTMRWSPQLLAFVKTMKSVDTNYSIGDRTVEDFALRASKFIPEAIVTLIDPHKTNGKTSFATNFPHPVPIAKSSGLTRPLLSDQLTTNAAERDPESMMTRRMPSATSMSTDTCSSRATSDSQKSSVGPTVEGEELQRAANHCRNVAMSTGSSTQEASRRSDLNQKILASPLQDTADRTPSTDEVQIDSRSTHTTSSAQQPVASDCVDFSSRASTGPRPYGHTGKSWGEFVVEVLLAERMARNEDELDYWHFVRSLYEI